MIKYTISIIALNNIHCTLKCLEHLLANTPEEFELIISDNHSDDGTRAFLAKYQHSNFRTVFYPYNTGFGYPHNQALKIANGMYFVVLNNDIYINEPGWLTKLSSRFVDNNKMAIVGFAGNQSYLNADGVGDYSLTGEHDYVEASCLMMPRNLALKYGLFSEEFDLAYYEDTDLSLRYRQMGFAVDLVPAQYEHERYSTSSKLDKDYLERVFEHNKVIFVKRWGNYLKKRQLNGKIIVRAITDNASYLLHITTIIGRLKDEQPLVDFHLVTSRPEVFRQHPALSKVYLPTDSIDNRDYDRVIDFVFDRLRQEIPVLLQLAEQAAVDLVSFSPLICIDEDRSAYNFKEIAGNNNSVLIERFDDSKALNELLTDLCDEGYSPILFSADESFVNIDGHGIVCFNTLTTIVSKCRLVYATPSVVCHIANGTNVRCLVLANNFDDMIRESLDLSKSIFTPSIHINAAMDAIRGEQKYVSANTKFCQIILYRKLSDDMFMWQFYKQKSDKLKLTQAILETPQSKFQIKVNLLCKFIGKLRRFIK